MSYFTCDKCGNQTRSRTECAICAASEFFTSNEINLSALQYINKNSLCKCDEIQIRNLKCVMCHITKETLMTKMEKREQCQVHGSIVISLCGRSEYVCKDCEKLGWLSTVGFKSEHDLHVNHILKRCKPKHLSIYNTYDNTYDDIYGIDCKCIIL